MSSNWNYFEKALWQYRWAWKYLSAVVDIWKMDTTDICVHCPHFLDLEHSVIRIVRRCLLITTILNDVNWAWYEHYCQVQITQTSDSTILHILRKPNSIIVFYYLFKSRVEIMTSSCSLFPICRNPSFFFLSKPFCGNIYIFQIAIV